MNKTVKKIIINLAQIAGLIVAALLVWYAAAAISGSELVVPQFHTVVRLTFSLMGKPDVWIALLATLARALAAFALSLAVAFGLSLLVGVYPKTRFCTDVVVTVLRALPTIAVILITLVMFPSDYVPIAVAFLVAFPIVYGTFVRGFERCGELFDVCKVYNMPPSNKIRYFLLPIVRDELLPATEETLPLCIKVVIAGEVLALPMRSIGREMYLGKVIIDTARTVALTLLVLVVCLVIDVVLHAARRRRHD